MNKKQLEIILKEGEGLFTQFKIDDFSRIIIKRPGGKVYDESGQKRWSEKMVGK